MAGRKPNETFEFAKWWFEFIGPQTTVESPEFRAMLGMAGRLRKQGYNLAEVRTTIRAMKNYGVNPSTPYSVRWRSPDGSKSWHEYARPSLPPMWDRLSAYLYENGLMPSR